MKIPRYFTIAGQDAYDGITFEPRKSEIKNPDGSAVFSMQNVMVPSHWSQVATDILAQKYFRKAGVKSDSGNRSEFGAPDADSETDSRQVFQLNSYDPAAHSSVPPHGLPGGSFWAHGLTCGLEFSY